MATWGQWFGSGEQPMDVVQPSAADQLFINNDVDERIVKQFMDKLYNIRFNKPDGPAIVFFRVKGRLESDLIDCMNKHRMRESIKLLLVAVHVCFDHKIAQFEKQHFQYESVHPNVQDMVHIIYQPGADLTKCKWNDRAVEKAIASFNRLSGIQQPPAPVVPQNIAREQEPLTNETNEPPLLPCFYACHNNDNISENNFKQCVAQLQAKHVKIDKHQSGLYQEPLIIVLFFARKSVKSLDTCKDNYGRENIFIPVAVDESTNVPKPLTGFDEKYLVVLPSDKQGANSKRKSEALAAVEQIYEHIHTASQELTKRLQRPEGAQEVAPNATETQQPEPNGQGQQTSNSHLEDFREKLPEPKKKLLRLMDTHPQLLWDALKAFSDEEASMLLYILHTRKSIDLKLKT